MLTYNRMLKLHKELHASYQEIETHLETILADDRLVVVTNRADERDLMTVSYYDPYQDMELESLISNEFEFKHMMKLQTKEELLSFLNDRAFA